MEIKIFKQIDGNQAEKYTYQILGYSVYNRSPIVLDSEGKCLFTFNSEPEAVEHAKKIKEDLNSRLIISEDLIRTIEI